MQEQTALVKGGGEVGTAVALELWRAGWRVLVCELPRPTVLRRQLSVAEAAFAGAVTRGGLSVVRVATPADALAALAARTALPLYVGPIPAALAALRPTLVVDARMRRGGVPEPQRGQAPLVVGLGPELVAGDTVDAVVETCPGPDLGRVIWHGAALPHQPLQRPAGSQGAEVYIHAPAAGLWRTDRAIGDLVTVGAVLGTLGGQPIRAPVAGSLRGLVHDALAVPAGLKVVAVHPGNWERKEAGIGYRAATIAASVLALAEQHAVVPAVAG
jgi:xanthine dehydrogenase accessory factor